jgi:dihydrofolate reductase
MLIAMAAASSAPPEAAAPARPAYWFPLALFGVIVALSVPLYALQLGTAPMASGWAAYAPLTRTVFWSSAHSSFSAVLSPGAGPLRIAEGWYWAAALAAVFLVTSLWYRRAGRRGPGLGYLITGLVLTAAVTAVPLLLMPRVPLPAWLWLTSQWDSGTFALLIIAVGLGILAARARSRRLAVVALAYTAVALAVDWPAPRSAPSALIVTDGDALRTPVIHRPAVTLPGRCHAARPGAAGRGGRVFRAAPAAMSLSRTPGLTCAGPGSRGRRDSTETEELITVGAIKVHEFVALDGVYEDPSWTFEFGFDPQMGEDLASITGPCQAILLGRRTFEMFAPAWSTRTAEEDPGAPFFNESPKYVVSGSLQTADWNNSTILGPYSADTIRGLKDKVDGGIYVSGSGTLVRAMLADGLVDELHLFVYPVARGTGQRLLADGGPATKFSLAGSDTYSNGVVHLSYTPAAG